MKMRCALSPADCDKMTHFLQYIARLHSNSNSRCRVDVSAAMLEYRRQYGATKVSAAHNNHLRNINKSPLRDKYAPTLEKYKAFPVGMVARMIGISENTVRKWYMALGIVRPFNYKGKDCSRFKQ